MFRLLILIAIFYTTPSFAVEFQGKFIQGHFIIGKTEPGASILVDKKKVKVSKDGYFAFGIEKERKLDIVITEENKNIVKKVLKRKYKIQKIDGLPGKKVTPPEEFYARIRKEGKLIAEARAIDSDLTFFKDKFMMPVEGIISGVYGSQRILNGKAKWPHYGIDIAAKQGTTIKSSGAGVVTMAEDDLYYTGGTIIMDHGHGISTIYSHLENILVSVGEKIKQGDIIGTVGSTGSST